MAETEKHGFSFPAGQQRQQENDSIASTPTISSDPPLPTGSITKKREEGGVLPELLNIILPSEATAIEGMYQNPNVHGLLELYGRKTEGEKAAAQRDGENPAMSTNKSMW